MCVRWLQIRMTDDENARIFRPLFYQKAVELLLLLLPLNRITPSLAYVRNRKTYLLLYLFESHELPSVIRYYCCRRRHCSKLPLLSFMS